MQNTADLKSRSQENMKNIEKSSSKSSLSTLSRTSSAIKATLEIEHSPLMLQDTTLEKAPPQLEKLFSHFKVGKLSKSDILFQLVYLIALESGFGEKNAFRACESDLKFNYIVTSFFNKHNVHCLLRQKPKFYSDKSGIKLSMELRNIVSNSSLENSNLDVNSVCTNMSAVVSGDLMIFSLSPLKFDKTSQLHSERSICLTIPRFVVGTVSKKGKKIQECLRNMKDLVLEVRNELFIPLRAYQFSILEFGSFPAILGLPFEVFKQIFLYLNNDDLWNLANVNTLLNYLVFTSRNDNERIIEREKPLTISATNNSSASTFAGEW